MLQTLRIKNFALITSLEMEFQDGFSVITGETGAGKSILLGGLGLVLGNRVDKTALRDTNVKCVIEAEFAIRNYELEHFFNSHDLDYEPNSILRREILPSGKSRAFVNDSPVNLSVLQALGNQLIDVHSQHQTLSLTQDAFLLQFVDAAADNLQLLTGYRKNFQQYQEQLKFLSELEHRSKTSNEEADYNKFLLDELLAAKLEQINLSALESEQEALSNVEAIKENLSRAQQIMSDETIGALQTLSALKQCTNSLANFGSAYEQLQSRVQSLYIEADDIHADLEQLTEGLIDDPAALQKLNDTLERVYALLKKHQAQSVSDLLEIQQSLGEKVQQTSNIEENIVKLRKEIEYSKKQLLEIANRISKNRKKVIPDLKDKLERALSVLGMPNASFSIKLNLSEAIHKDGVDSLEFLFSANKGGAYGSLKKVASGGELSRIMLTMKSILASYIQLPTIMFDEIDSGVSGDIAQKMGEIMRWMSKNMQVFSITHLPQVAAKGKQHFKVFKEDREETTVTQMKKLSKEERIQELAEMLGGKEITSSAISHAKELLQD